MEHLHKVQIVADLRFENSEELNRFKARFLEYIMNEKNIYILESNMDVTMITKEYKQSYGNLVEVGAKQTRMRI